MDAERINAWNSQKLPVVEPGLFDLVSIARDETPEREPNLLFSTVVGDAIRDADVVFVAVNTHTKANGIGAGKATDLSQLEHAIRNVARYTEYDAIVVQKSTVPCGTGATLQEILRANANPGVNLELLSNPEFLAEGTAVSNLLHPDRIVIGHFDTDTGSMAAKMLADLYAVWVPRDRIITMNTCSAELSKLAANALLAQRISSINALSAICDSTDADIKAVSYACGLDTRIGPAMLNSSVGFGGSCFKKDIMNLSYISMRLNLPEVAAYWEAIVTMNEHQQRRFVIGILNEMQNNLSGKRVAILGFAYKANTSDTRESPAVFVVKSLLAENAVITIYDPWVRDEQIYRDMNVEGPSEDLQVCSSPYWACKEAHAVIILTEWKMFSNMPSLTRPPRFTNDNAQKQLRSAGSLQTQISYPSRATRMKDLNFQKRYCSECIDALPQTLDTVIRTDDQGIAVNSLQGDGLAGIEPKMTPHCSCHVPERLDWSRVATLMERPMYVFDGRNIVDPYKLTLLGFRVSSIGSLIPAP